MAAILQLYKTLWIKTYPFCKLVGGWTNPFEKYARQISESSPSGDENKKYLKPPPSLT